MKDAKNANYMKYKKYVKYEKYIKQRNFLLDVCCIYSNLKNNKHRSLPTEIPWVIINQ